MPGSVTIWFEGLKDNRQVAVQELWKRYFGRLVRIARAKLGHAPRQAADEEDVALSAFHSFIRGAEEGAFPQMHNRDDLWQVLVLITVRKAVNQFKHETRNKRGAGNVRVASALTADDAGDFWESRLSREPDPGLAAEMVETYHQLLGSLGNEQLTSVAVEKLEGHTNSEIAKNVGCSLSTVERRLKSIRSIWSRADGESN